jgi:hypothetical protein
VGDGVGDGGGAGTGPGGAGDDVTVRGVSGAGGGAEVRESPLGAGVPGAGVVDGRGAGGGGADDVGGRLDVAGERGAQTGSTELRDSSSI